MFIFNLNDLVDRTPHIRAIMYKPVYCYLFQSSNSLRINSTTLIYNIHTQRYTVSIFYLFFHSQKIVPLPLGYPYTVYILCMYHTIYTCRGLYYSLCRLKIITLYNIIYVQVFSNGWVDVRYIFFFSNFTVVTKREALYNSLVSYNMYTHIYRNYLHTTSQWSAINIL